MKRLVVNADDFGLTEGISRGIVEANRGGILTSATLLANGAAFDSAVALARGAPGLGVGVHLNLTDGRPVAEPSAVRSLVNASGQFFGGPAALAARVFTRRIRLAECEREWDAQIEKVREVGIQVTHLDGHKHAHMLPALFPIAVRLARKHGIPGVRLAIERPMRLGALLRRHGGAAGSILMQRLRARALGLLARDCREQLRQAGVAFPMNFFGITQTGLLDAAELEAILRELPDGTSELMCHPGYADGTPRQSGTRRRMERERELEALTLPESRKVVAALGIQLIDYRGLNPS